MTFFYVYTYIDFHTSLSLFFQGKVFMYDRVLKPTVTQEHVYDVTAKPIVAGELEWLLLNVLRLVLIVTTQFCLSSIIYHHI